MKRMVMLCGCPGSGKSTWIKNYVHTFSGFTSVISRDEIRFMMVGADEPYFSREKEVWKKFVSDIKYHLKWSDNVIVDATHINGGSRGKLLRALGDSIKGVSVEIVVVNVDLETALRQNELRAGTRSYVPESVIRNMKGSFTMPTFEEGFDKIYVYNPYKEGAKYTIFEKE